MLCRDEVGMILSIEWPREVIEYRRMVTGVSPLALEVSISAPAHELSTIVQTLSIYTTLSSQSEDGNHIVHISHRPAAEHLDLSEGTTQRLLPERRSSRVLFRDFASCPQRTAPDTMKVQSSSGSLVIDCPEITASASRSSAASSSPRTTP